MNCDRHEAEVKEKRESSINAGVMLLFVLSHTHTHTYTHLKADVEEAGPVELEEVCLDKRGSTERLSERFLGEVVWRCV